MCVCVRRCVCVCNVCVCVMEEKKLERTEEVIYGMTRRLVSGMLYEELMS